MGVFIILILLRYIYPLCAQWEWSSRSYCTRGEFFRRTIRTATLSSDAVRDGTVFLRRSFNLQKIALYGQENVVREINIELETVRRRRKVYDLLPTNADPPQLHVV